MTFLPAITDFELLKERPALARLLAWDPTSVSAARFERGELSLIVQKDCLREGVALLRDDPELRFTFLSDITCVDWHPREPRFEVVYELLSMVRKERVRLKVELGGAEPQVDSLVSLWPGANYFEREVFDLFGIRFSGHPYLRRIMMPEDWEGHPLRKDYPVEGYR
ncbi:MAG: NADH-quinone oxidoreductase subunit C [Terriglobales bacterium]|jgi:NADH-quinone oxidoreductase subunit C